MSHQRADYSSGPQPALYFIAGQAVDTSSVVSDVFRADAGIHCRTNSTICSGRGVCGDLPYVGCQCRAKSKKHFFTGEYCETEIRDKSGAMGELARPLQLLFVTPALALALLLWSSGSWW